MKIIQGNILNIEKGYIFHQVNCRFTMGSGVALQIKEKWPQVYENYKRFNSEIPSEFKRKIYSLGCYQICPVSPELSVVNIFGQLNYGVGERQTDYMAIISALFSMIEMEGINSFASDTFYFPYLFGCGLGGGNWEIVSGIILNFFPNAIFVKYEK